MRTDATLNKYYSNGKLYMQVLAESILKGPSVFKCYYDKYGRPEFVVCAYYGMVDELEDQQEYDCTLNYRDIRHQKIAVWKSVYEKPLWSRLRFRSMDKCPVPIPIPKN